MTRMLALTVWQPWASLILIGAKPYEFRSWPAPRAARGKRIAIHAGARKVSRNEVNELIIRLSGRDAWTTALKPKQAMVLLDGCATGAPLPLSCILATAILSDCVRADTIMGEFGAIQNDSDRGKHFNWAWKLDDIQAVPGFPPARGAQGLWAWDSGAMP
jgi:hypothetical protein